MTVLPRESMDFIRATNLPERRAKNCANGKIIRPNPQETDPKGQMKD